MSEDYQVFWEGGREMELRTLENIEAKHSYQREQKGQSSESEEILSEHREGIKVLTRLLANFSTKVVLVPVDLQSLRNFELKGKDAASCSEGDKLMEAVGSGSVVYLEEDVSDGELNGSVRGVGKEACLINANPQVGARIAGQALRDLRALSMGERVTDAQNASLTRREAQTLRYMAEGYSNKQIARVLYVSEQTVKNHVSSVQHKLGAHNRTHAVVLALRTGCINIDEPVPAT